MASKKKGLMASKKSSSGKIKIDAAPEDLQPPGLQEGQRAPTFSLLDQQGKLVTSSELGGDPYVLYFYPRDDTPGCTTEACGFRDQLSDFSALDLRVLGVSPDAVGSHKKFADKFSLNFTLLSDPEKVLSGAYGVWAKKKNYGKEYMGVVRSTFLVDGKGVLRKAWRGVKVAGHVPAVLQAARELGQ